MPPQPPTLTTEEMIRNSDFTHPLAGKMSESTIRECHRRLSKEHKSKK